MQEKLPAIIEFSICKEIIENVSRVVIGKASAIESLLTALVAGGHVLIEDVPGVGKTLLAKALSISIGGSFKRIQFTPDLLPADITGFNIFDQRSGGFVFKPGPVMANVLLADEINRTVPRTQAALLESMEEHQVTIDGRTHMLPTPFFVMATQNPIELEGTFPLPEAQLDRFLMKIRLGYPTPDEEILIMDTFEQNDPLSAMVPVTDSENIISLRRMREKVHVSLPVKRYIADILQATRNHPAIRFGISPRGGLGLMRSAQAYAAIHGRTFVLPDDVKYLSSSVLNHRLVLTAEEKIKDRFTGDILDDILDRLPVPVE